MINKIIAALAIAAVFSLVRANETKEIKKEECTEKTTETVTVEEGKKPEAEEKK